MYNASAMQLVFLRCQFSVILIKCVYISLDKLNDIPLHHGMLQLATVVKCNKISACKTIQNVTAMDKQNMHSS